MPVKRSIIRFIFRLLLKYLVSLLGRLQLYRNLFPIFEREYHQHTKPMEAAASKRCDISVKGETKLYRCGREWLNAILLEANKQHPIQEIFKKNADRVTVPIALKDKGLSVSSLGKLEITAGTDTIQINAMEKESWNYFTFGETDIKLRSADHQILLGEPIYRPPLNDSPIGTPKCVVVIMVDTFVQQMIEDYNQFLPNTMSFFSNSRFFYNNYSTGTWTLPVASSIFTGLHAARHGVYHPTASSTLPADTSVLPELFEKSGYMTLGVSGMSASERLGTSYGFTRGFDRFVYGGRFFCDGYREPTEQDNFIFSTSLEQIRAFPDHQHFMFLHPTRLHGVGYGKLSLSSQVKCETEHSAVPPRLSWNQYNLPLTKKYQLMVGDLDRELGTFFEGLQRFFDDDEMVVCLTGDHGVNYLDEEDFLLSTNLTKLPMIVRSPQLPPGKDYSFVQTMDLGPSLLSLCGIDYPSVNLDSKLWPILGGVERKFALSESIYLSEYKLRVWGPTHFFDFECNIVNGTLETENAVKHLWRRDGDSESGKTLVDKDSDIYFSFNSFAMEHISSFPNRLVSHSEDKESLRLKRKEKVR